MAQPTVEHNLVEDSAGWGGYPRMTCYTCGEVTLVRMNCMSDLLWNSRREEFLNAHPNRKNLFEKCRRAWPLMLESPNRTSATLTEYFTSIAAQYGFDATETEAWMREHPDFFPDLPLLTEMTVGQLDLPQNWDEFTKRTDSLISNLFDGKVMAEKERYEAVNLLGILMASMRVLTEQIAPMNQEQKDEFLKMAQEEALHQLGWDGEDE